MIEFMKTERHLEIMKQSIIKQLRNREDTFDSENQFKFKFYYEDDQSDESEDSEQPKSQIRHRNNEKNKVSEDEKEEQADHDIVREPARKNVGHNIPSTKSEALKMILVLIICLISFFCLREDYKNGVQVIKKMNNREVIKGIDQSLLNMPKLSHDIFLTNLQNILIKHKYSQNSMAEITVEQVLKDEDFGALVTLQKNGHSIKFNNEWMSEKWNE